MKDKKVPPCMGHDLTYYQDYEPLKEESEEEKEDIS